MKHAIIFSAFIALAQGCNDERLGPEPTVIENPTACDIDEQIFELHCFSCHQENGVAAPILTLATLQDESLNSYIVPNDPAASFLFRKVSGEDLGENEGTIMPPGEGLDEALVETMRQWIDAGAPKECESE